MNLVENSESPLLIFCSVSLNLETSNKEEPDPRRKRDTELLRDVWLQ